MTLEGNLHAEATTATTAVAASKSNPKRAGSYSGGGGVNDLRSQTVDRLWSITENLNILYRENWTRLAAEEVLEFQEALFRVMRRSSSTSSAGGVSPSISCVRAF